MLGNLRHQISCSASPVIASDPDNWRSGQGDIFWPLRNCPPWSRLSFSWEQNTHWCLHSQVNWLSPLWLNDLTDQTIVFPCLSSNTEMSTTDRNISTSKLSVICKHLTPLYIESIPGSTKYSFLTHYIYWYKSLQWSNSDLKHFYSQLNQYIYSQLQDFQPCFDSLVNAMNLNNILLYYDECI